MMDDRKNKVLQAIIEDYVSTAEPVGSRTIVRKYSLGVSPATIRNEMAELEELGFLEQPHTSAGRVPSDRGYRYYVDCLMESTEASQADQAAIRRTFERKARELDTFIRETTRILSDRTQLTAVMTAPQMQKASFRELRLVPLGGDKAVLVYITDSGFIENQVLELPVEVTMLELHRVSEVLNEQLRGQPVEALSPRPPVRCSRNSTATAHCWSRRFSSWSINSNQASGTGSTSAAPRKSSTSRSSVTWTRSVHC